MFVVSPLAGDDGNYVAVTGKVWFAGINGKRNRSRAYIVQRAAQMSTNGKA